MDSLSSPSAPGPWTCLRWSWRHTRGLGLGSRLALQWRALRSIVGEHAVLRRLLRLHAELAAEGLPVAVPQRAARALVARPGPAAAHRVRIAHEHLEWTCAAFQPGALADLLRGGSVEVGVVRSQSGNARRLVLLEEADPLREDGELRLTLADPVQRHPDDRHGLTLSCFMLHGRLSMAICESLEPRRAPWRLATLPERALGGWHPACLLAGVASELAEFWRVQLVVWNPSPVDGDREQDEGLRAIVETFCGAGASPGWVPVPQFPVDLLFAVSRSPEERELQANRADFWLRVRREVHEAMRLRLESPLATNETRTTDLLTVHYSLPHRSARSSPPPSWSSTDEHSWGWAPAPQPRPPRP